MAPLPWGGVAPKAAKPRWPTTTAIFVVTGISGLLGFPAAGLALLLDRIDPLTFGALSLFAVTTFLASLGKLERGPARWI